MSSAYLKAPPVATRPAITPFHCAGKAQFESPALAAAVAARSPEKRLTHYRCDFCGLFHLGSNTNLVKNRKKKTDENLVRTER